MLLNNSKLGYLGTSGAVSESPRVGATEIWEIINLTADTHPIHTHLVSFQVLSRQSIQTAKYVSAYDASFPGGFNPADGLTYPPGAFMPGYGPPLGYGACLAGTVCGATRHDSLRAGRTAAARRERGRLEGHGADPSQRGHADRGALGAAHLPVEEVEPGETTSRSIRPRAWASSTTASGTRAVPATSGTATSSTTRTTR